MEAVFLNTAGGVTGGDRFSLSMDAAPGTTLTTTSQACERIYKAQPGQCGLVDNRLQIASRARVNWLPQETILFNQSALDRRLSIEMADDATLLMVEPLVFGRAAMGETLTDIRFRDRIEIRRGGVPVYLDAVRLDGDAHSHLARPFIAAGAQAMASLVYVCDDAESQLTFVRSVLPQTAGASLIGDGVLVVRLLAEDSFELRQTLLPLLTRLIGGALPRCWMT